MVETVSIRRAEPDDAQGIARVHVESWRTTYPGIVADTVLDRLSVDARADFWSRELTTPESGNFHHVAVDETGVIGFASGGAEREGHPQFQGELFAIYILEAFQGRALGKQLVCAVVNDLLDAGYAKLLVWVLADNPARHFYASLGGRQVASKLIAMGPDELEEVAYGWDDLAALAERLRSNPATG